MEMEPLCHSCMLSMVRNWHMGNPISFSHGHLRLYLATIKAMVNQLGSVAWALLSHLILCTAVTSKNKTKKNQQQKGGLALAQCWKAWQRGDGSGRTIAEHQPVALWQGRTICFQVYFILRCTLLIKWTSNPFGKPHGAQIHLTNLSFSPGDYLD